MLPCSAAGYGYWWMFPVIMIAMMVLCFVKVRGRMGSMTCRPGRHDAGSHGGDATESALDILNRRFARGEINKEEYEEKRGVITRHA